MVSTFLPVPLAAADYSSAVQFVRQSLRAHVHIDWQEFEEWLPSPAFFSRALWQDGQLTAFTGATVHRPPADGGAAWLRFIIPGSLLMDRPLLDRAWFALRDDLVQGGMERVALLINEPWIGDLGRRWGFQPLNSITTLRRDNLTLGASITSPSGVTIRLLRDADLPAVVSVDNRAFSPIWQYDLPTLQSAREHPGAFFVMEYHGAIIAYMICTLHGSSGHLARLAVLPELLGRGLGGLMLSEMARYFSRMGASAITLNTQSDNVSSLHLYRRWGFRDIGFSVPVWELLL